MKKLNKYVGLDVHNDTTVMVIAEGDRDGEVRPYGQFSSDLGVLEKILRKIGDEGATCRCLRISRKGAWPTSRWPRN